MRLLFVLLFVAGSGGLKAQRLALVQNGRTKYVIIIPATADSNEVKAGNELSAYLHMISGASLKVIREGDRLPTNGIYIGNTKKRFNITNRSLYLIQRSGSSLTIRGSRSLQTLEAVYLFLEEYASCQFLGPGAELVPQTQNLIVDHDYAYEPKVRTRTVHSKLFYAHPEFAAKSRVTTEAFPGFVPEARVHTFNRFVPQKLYFNDHPEYFALVNGKRQPTQLCLSNDTVFWIVRDSVTAMFKRYPDAQVISVSQDDNTQYCICERCAKTDAEEGSPAGSMLRLVNRVAAEFPGKTIATLAYQYTRKAPKITRPARNVLITLCSIECDRSAPIASKCKDFESDIKEWGAIGATIQIWDYTTQFTNFFSPFPNLETLKPNIQLFVDNNTTWIFEQHSNEPGDLFELRSWLTARLLWNPGYNYDSLVHVFMTGFYGEAGPHLESYTRELQSAIKQYPGFFLFLYGDPSQAFDSWLDAGRIKRFQSIFDEAMTKAGSDEVLADRIRKARIGIDFALLEYYRRNTAEYPLSDTGSIQQLLSRFQRSANLLNARMMNEMGLPIADYINGYRRFMSDAATKSLALGKPVTVLHKAVKYANEDPQALTDGRFGGWSFYSNYLGFLNDMDATVDLGEIKDFSKVSVSFLQVTNHVVFFPLSVEFYVSEDDHEYKLVETVANKFPLEKTSKTNDIQAFSVKQAMKARYVRVVARNMKSPPYWHHAAGTGAWIFADEIVIN